MKMLLITLPILFAASTSLAAAPILVHNSKPVTSAKAAQALFLELVDSKETGAEVDVCYEGGFEEALANTEKKTRGGLIFNLIDVYGEDEYPTLDLEISNQQGETTSALVPGC